MISVLFAFMDTDELVAPSTNRYCLFIILGRKT